jgi:hypothetical protein
VLLLCLCVAAVLCRAADVPGGSILSSSDERLQLGFDCLMAQVPFWLAGQAQVVDNLVTALEHLNVSTVQYMVHDYAVLLYR